jgi:hypothetical protein
MAVFGSLRRVAALSPLALAAIYGAISLWEWWSIGVVADPATIAGYHFGSESMVAHGGAKYSSAAAYARSSLVNSAGAGALAACLGIAYISKALWLKGVLWVAGLALLVASIHYAA